MSISKEARGMKIRLKNFKGLKAGPELTWDGMDEIEIDFTGRNGLVAFAGENGGGKSTLLENLHHYPQLVSRSGALWQHTMGREAEKEFESEFMGHLYRSVIKMDADQGKQEGYLWIDGVPAVNGKITQYKEKVNDIFGQPFTYFRSQFCPQKSKNTQGMQIENMTAGVFRELLQQFLNLQRYAVWEDTAKQAGNILQGQIAGIDQRIASLRDVVNAGTEIDNLYGSYAIGLKDYQQKRDAFNVALRDCRSTVEAIQGRIHQNALAIARRVDIQQQIDRLTTEFAKEAAAAETDIAGYAAKYREIKTAIGAVDSVLRDREAILNAVSAYDEYGQEEHDLRAKIDEMVAALAAQQQHVHDTEMQVAILRQDLHDIANDREIIRLGSVIDDHDRSIRDQEKALKDLDSDFQLMALETEITNLTRAARVGEGIDADCKSTTCAAIKSVNEAKEKLPQAIKSAGVRKTEVEAVREAITATLKEIRAGKAYASDQKANRLDWLKMENEDIDAKVKTITKDIENQKRIALSTGQTLTDCRLRLSQVQNEITLQRSLAARLPEIKAAALRETDLEKQLAEVTALGTARKTAWEAKAKEIDDTLQYHLGAMAAYQIDATAEEELRQVTAEIVDIENVKIPDVEKTMQDYREKIASLKAEMVRTETACAELGEAQRQRDALALRVSRWRYLQLGCGKTGLQNLRIDGAAPHIIYNANRLLAQAYGARYAVRLETQNDAGKEDLQIKIIMENGQEVYLDDISGGQRAWNVQALWLAMSLLNQEKSGRKYDYFCSDESDGALDVENAEKYTALYRPFMQEAGLSQLIYISHKPSCRAMADHVLSFEHGKNPSWA